ncbi:THAP domain-containing protein 1-like [Ascaphus truei]|uniref:THAP domain-containing protein 1-like n=1 Tax=Ascaphus truei TaxID=8439 RepID=UPI003F5917BD
MPACAAINCRSRQTRGCGKSFHRFPHGRPDVLKKWVTNMRRDIFKPSSKAVLCSDHFEEFCFDRTGQTIRLRTDAVPTMFTFPERMKKDRKLYNPVPAQQDTKEQQDIKEQPPSPPLPSSDEIITMQEPVEKCVTAEHDYCITDSPRALKRRLDEALSTLNSVKRRLKVTQQKFRKLKFKVQSLE